jgi:hypothetical protein
MAVEHMPPAVKDEVAALLQRIEEDLDRVYELTGVGDDAGGYDDDDD